MKNRFGACHPWVNFIYYLLVLMFSMFWMHPVAIVISFIMSIVNCAYLKGVKKTIKSIGYMLIMALMIIVINPLFNHQGMTALYFFSNGNALTLESVLYGVFMAMMLMSVIMWFQSYNVIMSSDKFIYLFGRISPHLSLVLSMILQFIPRFKNQFRQIRKSQKGIGKDFAQGNVFEKIGHFADELSIMISWSMESSIETADSMKARGYGLPGRTAYSIYHFKKRDGILLGIISLLSIGIVALIGTGKIYYQYFPVWKVDLNVTLCVCVFGLYIVLCMIPLIVGRRK